VSWQAAAGQLVLGAAVGLLLKGERDHAEHSVTARGYGPGVIRCGRGSGPLPRRVLFGAGVRRLRPRSRHSRWVPGSVAPGRRARAAARAEPVAPTAQYPATR